MNKKILLIGGIILFCVIGTVLFFMLKPGRAEGTYYVKVTDDNAPSTTYTLNINKNGEFTLNDHFSAALSDGVHEEDTDYSGIFTDEIMNKIDAIAKKINVTKGDYTLYYEPKIDFKDGRWYAAVYMTHAISLMQLNSEENVNYGKCMLDEVVKLDIDQMPDNIYENVSKNCKR